MVGSGEETRAYRVTGLVQGVGFRWWVSHRAEALGLRGVARNLADGAVEVVAAGRPEALDRLAELLAAGPPSARVAAVVPTPVPTDALPDGFEIR